MKTTDSNQIRQETKTFTQYLFSGLLDWITGLDYVLDSYVLQKILLRCMCSVQLEAIDCHTMIWRATASRLLSSSWPLYCTHQVVLKHFMHILQLQPLLYVHQGYFQAPDHCTVHTKWFSNTSCILQLQPLLHVHELSGWKWLSDIWGKFNSTPTPQHWPWSAV